MMKPLDLREVERGVRQSYAQDGVTHLFMGLLLAMIGLSLFSSSFSYLGGLAALLIFPVEIVRRRVTYPRVGYAKLAMPRGMARGMLGFIVVAVGLLAFMAFYEDGRYQQFLPVAIGFIFALAFYFGSSLEGMSLTAWVLMALIIASGFVSASLLKDWHQGTAMQLWALSIILLVLGSVKLVRFLRNNPIVEPENGI
jgi:hypothetical protein